MVRQLLVYALDFPRMKLFAHLANMHSCYAFYSNPSPCWISTLSLVCSRGEILLCVMNSFEYHPYSSIRRLSQAAHVMMVLESDHCFALTTGHVLLINMYMYTDRRPALRLVCVFYFSYHKFLWRHIYPGRVTPGSVSVWWERSGMDLAIQWRRRWRRRP